MTFNPTFDIGTILNLLAVLVGLILVARRLGAIETKIEIMWRWFQRRIDELNGGK